ncbi:MAG TPA: FHA domain-containing protein [Phycisphaerae bacterium]|nr:FHA domain-containing protein [Phycisphaerae bacterium]
MATEKNDADNLPSRRPTVRVSSTGARAHLTCVAGPEKGQTFRIAPATTTIGRDASCDVVLAETAISRQHCRIERRGDAWAIVNMSSNGTRLKKKPVEEAILADGNEIRIGAKTRLEFVVEELPKLAGGRPQFRARSIGDEADAAEEEVAEVPQEQASLFKRRKGLFIGLGAYLGLMLIMAAILGFGGCPTMTQRGGIPRLGLDEMIIPAPGAKPLRIARAGPEGIWCENELGEPRLVSNEDISSGKAVHVPGIRQAIDVQYLEPSQAPKGHLYVIDQKNRGLAERDKKKAIEQYLVCDMPGKEQCLFDSVRLFQRALAYYGMTFLPDSNENKIRLTALDRLIDKVHNLYTQAIVFEKAGEYQQAWATYKTILKYVPEAKNPVFRNVSRRMAALKPHMPKKR